VKEPQKTGIFAAIAIVALVAALLTQPRLTSVDTTGAKAMVGKELFPEFTDPQIAASLSLVKFDESLGTLSEFEVRKDGQSGLWTIPSHAGYPADATAQMRDAATLFVGMKILGLASESREDHSLYGVVEPDVNRLKVGDQGVGMMVRIKDGKDKDLASLVIGKEIANQPGRRFVRIPSQDATYDVQINTAPLTTEFGKWIEKDLLNLSSFDIAELGIRDYSILKTEDRGLLQKLYDADLAFDTNSSKWNIKSWVAYEGRNASPQQIPADKVVNDSRLNEVKNALDQLEIVDVDRKPTGLSADLKADKDILSGQNADLLSLNERGFFPIEVPGGGTEILSTSGELLVTLNDGVQYVLRFGNLIADQSGAEGSGLNRRLMLTAKLDEARFPPPELQPLPETIEDLKKLDQAGQPPAVSGDVPLTPPATDVPAIPSTEAAPPATETPATETPAAPATDNPAPAADAPPAPPAADAPPAPAVDAPAPGEPKVEGGDGSGNTVNAATDSNNVRLVAFQPPAEQPPAEQPPAVQPPAEQPPAAAAPADASQPPAADVTAPAAPAAEAAAAPKQETEEELKERLDLVREEITKENQRKIEDRNNKLEKAKIRVQTLNARFADWYYVISEDMYKKLRVTQPELVTSPQPNGEAGSPNGLPGNLPGNFSLPFAPGGN
jgi:hypothetical protein